MPRWVAPFLRALERTGKVRAAALDAGVDFSTAYARRRAHGEFAAAWAAALERARVAKGRAREAELAETVERVGKGRVAAPLGPLAFAPSPSQAFGLGPSLSREGRGVNGEEELVLRPSATGAPKLVKASAGRWGRKRQEAYLAGLAATGNHRRASTAAGISYEAVLRRRRNDPALEAACKAAIAHCRARAPEFLASAMVATFDPESLPDDGVNPLPKVSIADAIRIAEMKGPRGAGGADGAAAIEAYDVGEVRQRLETKMRVLGLVEERDRAADGWTRAGGEWVPPGWAETVAIGLSAEAGEPELARTCAHCGETLYLAVGGGEDGIIDRTPDSGR
ncbi:MAG TPA: hypothetical protein VFK19_12110 [Sphingomicrobium sp.]|nr:hypothetical protein [Sphingomicrobium sp.]